MRGHDRRGIAWALAAALSLVAMAIPWKAANTLGDARVNTLILLLGAALFNTALVALRRQPAFAFRRFDLAFAAALAVLTLLGNLASAGAIARMSAALLTVVQRSEVIFVALMAWPLIGERIDRRFVIGAALASVGVVAMYDPFASGAPSALGMTLAGLSAVCFSGMAVLTRKFVHRLQLVPVNALRLWMSVGLWFALSGFPPELLEVSPAQAVYAGLAALFGPFLGRLSLMMSAQYLEARLSTLAMLAAPPLTLVLAALLLDDRPGAREILGGAIMLAGIAIPILAPGVRARGASPARGGGPVPPA